MLEKAQTMWYNKKTRRRMTVKAKIVPKKEIVLLYRHGQAKNAQALLPLLERLQVE